MALLFGRTKQEALAAIERTRNRKGRRRTGSGSGTPPVPSTGNYAFGATRLRVPNIYGTMAAGATYAIHESSCASPDYLEVDPILHLAGWCGNNSMPDCPVAGWKTTAAATASSNVFTFASIAGVQVGYLVTVEGAGAAGARLSGYVTGINGSNVTLDAAASTTVAAGYTVTTIAVTGSITSGTNALTVSSSAGMYVGMKLNTPGAGASGVALTAWIIGIAGNVVSLGSSGVSGALNASTTVVAAVCNVIPTVIDYFGVAIKAAGGAWVKSTAMSEAAPLTVDANSYANGGITLPPILGVSIPANTAFKMQLFFRMDAGAQVLPTIERNAAGDKVVASVDRTSTAQGSASSLSAMFATDNLSGTHNGLSGTHCPAFMLGKRSDTRDVFLLVTDSIGYNKNDAAVPNARFEAGFMTTGLDDNSTTKRLAFGHIGVPGTNPQQLGSRASWNFRLNALESLKAAVGAQPFNKVMTNQGTNSAGNLLKGYMVSMFSYMRIVFNATPIIQLELLARPTSTDGYQTVGNQSAAIYDLYASRSTALGGDNSAPGGRWDTNIAIGGPNGNADSTAEFRNPGAWGAFPLISDSIAPWKYGSFDTAANRDKIKIRPSSGVISGVAYTANNLVARVDFGASTLPVLGDTMIFYNSATPTTASFDSTITQLTLVSGTVYDVTLVAGGAAQAIGNAVACALHDRSGLHPGTYGHRSVYAQAIIDWKTARSYV